MSDDNLRTIMPWDLLYPKQLKLFNTGIATDAGVEHPDCPTILLLDGPRKAAKTHGVIHRGIRHLWELPGARAALVVKITRSATDGGVWNDIIGSDVLPGGEMQKWLDAGLTEYTTQNKFGGPAVTDSKTRSIYFRIRNMHGGESELRLFNLEHDHDVGPVMKSTCFSMIWFSELTNFRDKNVLKSSWEQLRMPHLKRWQHLWMGDTNPSPEGEDDWIYQFFYKREGIERPNTAKTGGMEQYLKSTKRITFFLSDNIGMTEAEREIQRANYADDPGEEARMVDGLWTKGHGNKGKHFADVFSRAVHVVGGGPGEKDQIALSPNTQTLYTGWDLGDTTNHAAGIMEKRIVPTIVTLDKGTELQRTEVREVSSWNVIDSMIHIGDEISTTELGTEMLAKMHALDERYTKKFDWIHYSDDTALTRWRPSGATYDYLEIQAATNDEINLTGVSKPAGTLKKRVQLLRKLLRQQRFFVSAKCVEVIAMLEQCRQGAKDDDYVEWGPHKHVFDWISYVLIAELPNEIELESKRPKAIEESESGLVTVRL
jgi:hypothetical protein